MESFIYLVGAVYLAASVVWLTFWAVAVIEGRRYPVHRGFC